MARKKERIDTSGGDTLSGNNPFSALSADGLKSIPETDSIDRKQDTVRKKPTSTLLLRRLKAGKGGKVVTEVSGFDMNPQQIDAMLKRLQARLGTGGTRKGKVLELQGEKRLEIKSILEQEGFSVRGI